MFNPFVCGSGSFHRDQEDDEPWSSPRRSKSCSRSSAHKMNKNPYSTRGLDKFAMVLADLDERRQKIYEQMGLQDEYSLVRFGYSSSKGNWVPIVVKLKGQDTVENKAINNVNKQPPADSEALKYLTMNKSSEVKEVEESQDQTGDIIDGRRKKIRSLMMPRFISTFCAQGLMRPYYYLALVVILILVCLVIYGRSFAIICTSISWYLVPTIKGKDSNYLRRSMKKKDLVKKLSDNKMRIDGLTSPRRKNLRLGLSQKQHGN